MPRSLPYMRVLVCRYRTPKRRQILRSRAPQFLSNKFGQNHESTKCPFHLYAGCPGGTEASRRRGDADCLGPALVPTRRPRNARNTLRTLSARALLARHAGRHPGAAPAGEPSRIPCTLLPPCVPAASDSAASEGTSCFPNRVLCPRFARCFAWTRSTFCCSLTAALGER